MKPTSLGRLGSMLIFGGGIVIYNAKGIDQFYTGTLEQTSSAGWGFELGIALILGGIATLFAAFIKNVN